jgi:hypothetical protein
METPKTWKEWGAVLGVVAILGGLYLHLHTDLEAAAMKKEIDKDIATLIIANTAQQRATQISMDRSEKLRLEREIRRLRQDRKYPDADKAQIDEDIEYYQGIINCIRAQLMFCE